MVLVAMSGDDNIDSRYPLNLLYILNDLVDELVSAELTFSQ
jgi:hypothetical protein